MSHNWQDPRRERLAALIPREDTVVNGAMPLEEEQHCCVCPVVFRISGCDV